MSEPSKEVVEIRPASTEEDWKAVKAIAVNGITGQSKNLSQQVFWHPIYLAACGFVFLGVHRLANMTEGNTFLRTILLGVFVSASFLTVMEIPCRKLFSSLADEMVEDTGNLRDENLKHFYLAYLNKDRLIGIIGLLPPDAVGAYNHTPTIVHWNVIPKFYKFAYDLLDVALNDAKKLNQNKVSAKVFTTDKWILQSLKSDGFEPVVDEAFDYLSFFGLRHVILQTSLKDRLKRNQTSRN
ncbi:endoplasmic reticulum resident protein [Schizosaccharomyces cryophilus OY26]|uniref:Endoplasmic reticulum resident protein n=1 Tax=Schizosaccharomyces cryophilus (strain OY26 / ATCC MYA-4695 / CBS 11777 / NBRC 106824 / NRRL Y48691) TaxID=653667 RepID=S9X0F2_SCHCR|nr:endoplasmic reticulum resident protein [Schizosaccharomyces cryophilus OY26]EPY50427.1 endoplasmic reticulum resident protein [Schizosaccharomyces cryophilus OY26]